MILKSVIHNWDDERATAILSRCRTAAVKNARLLLMERMMPDRMSASATNQRAATLDMRMLAVAGGRERTENEYRTMLADAGFTWERSIVLPAPLDQCMIEAVVN